MKETPPTMTLEHDLRIADPDGFYEALVRQQRDLSEDDALLFQARLLLVLANHVGDRAVLDEAMAVARRGLGPR